MVSFNAVLIVFALPLSMLLVGCTIMALAVGISRLVDHWALWAHHLVTNVEISFAQIGELIPGMLRPVGQIAYGLGVLLLAVWPSTGQTAEILPLRPTTTNIRALLALPTKVVDMRPIRVRNRAPNGQYAAGWHTVWVSSQPLS